MKKYYIVIIQKINKRMHYDEATDTEINRYTANIYYQECDKSVAMERLERDRKLINMIDKLRAV
jgi:hypothetical protein